MENKKIKKVDENNLSAAQLCNIWNVKPPYISKLKREGKLVFNSNNRISLEEANKQREGSSDPQKQHKKKDFDKEKSTNINQEDIQEEELIDLLNVSLEDFTKSAFRLNFNETKIKDLQFDLVERKVKLDEKLGKLVSADETKNQAFEIAKTLKDNLLNIPNRIASQLSVETEVSVIKHMLTEEIKSALNNIIDSLNK